MSKNNKIGHGLITGAYTLAASAAATGFITFHEQVLLLAEKTKLLFDYIHR